MLNEVQRAPSGKSRSAGNKTKFIFSVCIALCAILFAALKPPSEGSKTTTTLLPTSNTGSNFLIGAMTDGWQANYSKLTDTLGFNIWHRYINGGMENGQFNIHGWTSSDELNANINDYRTDIRNILDDNNTHGMRTLMERPKITRLAYGERSDYQCENTHLNQDLWFYSYNIHDQNDTDVYDDDVNYGCKSWVRYCQTSSGNGPNNPRLVVGGLKANREQVNMNDRWEGDKSYGWIVKPSIRADMDFVNNPSNSDTAICRIEVLNYDGNLIKSTLIKARNFPKDQITLQYDGRYKEEFLFTGTDSTLTFPQQQAENFNPPQPNGKYKSWYVPDGECHVDFRVYWYGNCNMWIDYVRVDNDIADQLFKGNFDNTWIQWEAEDIARYTSSPYKFYIEEFEFNNIPCMSYVSRKLKSYNPDIGLMCDLNYNTYNAHIPFTSWATEFDNFVNVNHVKKYLIDGLGSSEIFMGAYPFSGFPESSGGQNFSLIPNTLPCGEQSYNDNTGMLTHTVTVPEYDNWLQQHLDDKSNQYWSFLMNTARGDSLSKLAEIPFINIFQTHLWWNPGHMLREPINEELEMTSNLALSYGAKGIFYFWYEGFGNIPRTLTNGEYGRGLTNPVPGDIQNPFEETERETGIIYDARTQNVYGQNKWQKIIDINTRLKTLGPYFMSFDNTNRHSYRIYDENERYQLLNPENSYFADIVTYKQNPPQGCPQDDPGGSPNNLYWECHYDRYFQAATFNTIPGNDVQYFMLVDRRCSPLHPADNIDGKRFVRVRFNANSSYFTGYESWKIIDLSNNSTKASFKKSESVLLDLDWFNPGEGKLYKIAPVMKSGGTLLANEEISGNLTIEDTIFSSGHDIKFIGNQNTISFSDSGMIIMNGGTFQTDSASDGPQQTKNKFQAAMSGHKWGGLQFTGCSVKIYNSQIQDISSYALNCINCPLIDFRYNLINSNSDTAGGISIAYTGTTIASCYNYVMYNTFNMNNSYSLAVQVQGFGGNILGTYITGNTINSNGGATGILVSTVTGGIIKNNTISGCGTGINTIFSSCDVCGNTITSSNANSIGIQATDQSIINMQPTDGDWFGGINSITNGKGNSINLSLDCSVFGLAGGYNIFNVDTSGSSSPYHIYGSFWESDYNNYTKASNNCFMISGNTISDPLLPLNNVMDQYSNNINLNFNPYNCNTMVPNGSDVVDIFNGVYDTILTSPQGGGKGGMFVVTPKQLYDSICINFRHRSYSNAKTKCMQLLNTYPDSSQSIAALRILYLASILTDTSSASYTTLKTFYETLILNHGNNNSLVDICNYLVQKCKVLLHQYSSALTGFQSIINNNQYNYEGLLARWDFMATSLLMNGGGGGEPMYGVGFSILDLQADEATDDNGGPKDKSPFTKDQRKIISGAVNKTFETNKNKDEEKIKSLTKQVKNGDDKSKKELNKMNVLKDVIKSEQPKNIMEHLKIVNSDIKKVFGGKSVNISKDKGNNIPQAFSISQNYPNPFNPTTTIKYALPKDVKVTIKIYDILGKLVITLVNGEQKKAGYYEAQFDGTNFASGVYFYRIEAGEFVQSKKMVLVK